MTFIAPALAGRYESKRLKKGSWAVDTKEDGHRVVVNSFTGEVWSRNCKPIVLAPHLVAAVQRLPFGIYDGERIRPGGISYDVSRIDKPEEFRLVFFDLLSEGGSDITSHPYVYRRRRLESMVASMKEVAGSMNALTLDVRVSELLVEQTNDEQVVLAAAAQVWAAGGEGIVLKERSSPYRPGKRMLQWLKLKRESLAVGVLIGFEAGLTGPHSVAVVQDDQGNQVRMKAKDHEWLRRMDAEGEKHIGRKVVFEYTERTPYGAYREPRWDRFEDE